MQKTRLARFYFSLALAIVLTLLLTGCQAAATVAPAVPAAPKNNVQNMASLKSLQTHLTATIANLEKKAAEDARQSFKKFLDGWEDLEGFVKPAVRYGYRDVELSLTSISQRIFNKANPPDTTTILPEAKELQRKYGEVVTALETMLAATPTAQP